MPRRIQLKEGKYYHLRNFGADNRQVFRTNADRLRFIQMLFLCNSKNPVVVRDVRNKRRLFDREREELLTHIGAYVLTPESFELVVHEFSPGGTSKFMQKILTGYSMYVNHQYGREGRLFAGSYKAKELTSEEEVTSAIINAHLLPISVVQSSWREEGFEDVVAVKQYLEQYQHSSYFDYCGINRRESVILSRESFEPQVRHFEDDCFATHLETAFE